MGTQTGEANSIKIADYSDPLKNGIAFVLSI